jgi:hypothetical protein
MALPAPRTYAAFREGKKLVISRAMPGVNEAAPLPALCVKCGAPSSGTLSSHFHWHAPWIYIFVFGGVIPYVLAAIVLRKRLDVKVPLCADHRRRRRNRSLAGLLVAAAGAALPFVAPGFRSDETRWVLAVVAAVVGGLLMAALCARTLSPLEIDEGGGTFSGADERFLEKLP